MFAFADTIFPGQVDYDRAITMFSPEGRLLQVEYSRIAGHRGATTIGLKFKDGVVLLADKGVNSRLQELGYVEKVFQIDKHIGCGISGLMADAQALINYARFVAQINKITYGEKIPVDLLVKKVCDLKSEHTQYGGVRPFGASLLVAGVDDSGPQLWETDTSGALTGYKAGCIGMKRREVIKALEDKYVSGMDITKALSIGWEILSDVTEHGIETSTVEVGVVTADDGFRRLSKTEIEKYIKVMRNQ